MAAYELFLRRQAGLLYLGATPFFVLGPPPGFWFAGQVDPARQAGAEDR